MLYQCLNLPLDASQIAFGLPKHVSLSKLTKLLTKSGSENPLVIIELLEIKQNRISEFAVCVCPLAFACFYQCEIGLLHAPARVWLLCIMSKWGPHEPARVWLICFMENWPPARVWLLGFMHKLPFAHARSRLADLVNVQLAVCTRPLVFYCFSNV